MRKPITSLLGLICLGIGGLITTFSVLAGLGSIMFIGTDHALGRLISGIACVVSICIATGMFQLGGFLLKLGKFEIQGLTAWIRTVSTSSWRLGTAVAVTVFFVGAAWYQTIAPL